MTLFARKALMALPYCPEPPGPALMSSMRLSATSVPSSPIAVRRISMPLSLVPVMVLRATIRPSASNDTIAVVAVLVMMLPEISPETCSSQMPLPPLPDISQSLIRTSRPARQWIRPRRSGRGMFAAVERDAGKAQAVGAFGEQHRRAAVEDEFGRAAHADELCAARKPQRAGAIDGRAAAPAALVRASLRRSRAARRASDLRVHWDARHIAWRRGRVWR